MSKFNVLFVDDERDQFETVEHLIDDTLEIVYAQDQDEALDALLESFFHLALIDVSLEGRAQNDRAGIFVLNRIRELRPSCERMLLTTILGEDRREVLRELPPQIDDKLPLVHGLVDKVDSGLRASDLIRHRAGRFLRARLEIEGRDAIQKRVDETGICGAVEFSNGDRVLPSADELDFLFTSLFNAPVAASDPRLGSVTSVELHPMSEGWSTSIVARCRPRAGKLGQGPLCVLKIGPREDANQESARYRAFVRYGLPLEHRVEMLDSVLGDTLGVVCYSHGSSDVEIGDLQHAFDAEDEVAVRALDRLLSADEQFWFKDESEGADLLKFFHDEYSLRAKDLVANLWDFIDDETDFGRAGNRTFRWGSDETAPLPGKLDLSRGVFTGPYPACVVHGDLHGGNVLIDGEGQPKLIDYRNLTRGPRCLDFASLEVSIRLSSCVVDECVDNLELFGERLRNERATWEHDWRDGAPADDGSAPYWCRLSTQLRRLARDNFESVTEEEYAAVCLMRALRVFSARALKPAHKASLLPWISTLTGVLRPAETHGATHPGADGK